MRFDPLDIDARQCYGLLTGAVVPRPIAWISSLSATGTANLAPYSFFTVASCQPPVLCVTQVNPRDRLEKDTLVNLRATGECVVNIVSLEHAALMNACCANFPPEISEFVAVGVVPCASRKVAPPGVHSAHVRFECRLRDIVQVSLGPSGGKLMLLDVVDIFVDDAVLVEGAIDGVALAAIGKLGGDYYATTAHTFALARP